MNMSDRQNDVPKLLSNMSSNAADSNTGNEITPIIAVTKNAQIVNGNLVIDIPFVRRLKTVTIQFSEPNKDDAMNIAIDTSHSVIPNPEPEIACGNALSGGQIVQPADAAPPSTNNDSNMMTLEMKNNQQDTMFRNPEAISRAPICNGINKLLNVPLNPAVSTKNTMMVP